MAYELRLGIRIRAPRETVFEHLLTPHHLARWWCNFAQVEPKPDGKFVFGGDYAIAQPEGHAFACKFTGGVIRKSVTFAWPLFGAETSVTWDVEDASDGCVLRATHTNLPTLESTCGSLHDAWRVCLGNLKAVAEGRGDSLRPDHSPVREPRIKLDLLLDVPRQRAFGALVDPVEIRKWADPPHEPVVEPQVGGPFDLGGPEHGHIEALQMFERLAVDWREGNRATRFAFRLEEKSGDRCGLYFLHEGFAAEDAQEIVRLRGRWSDFLVALKNVLEAGEAGFTDARDAQVVQR